MLLVAKLLFLLLTRHMKTLCSLKLVNVFPDIVRQCLWLKISFKKDVPKTLNVVIVVVETAHLSQIRHCCSAVDLSILVTNNLISLTNFRWIVAAAKVQPFDEPNSTRTILTTKT